MVPGISVSNAAGPFMSVQTGGASGFESMLKAFQTPAASLAASADRAFPDVFTDIGAGSLDASTIANVVDHPTASNLFRAGIALVPNVLPPGSAGPVGGMLNVIDHPTVGNIASAGITVASALGSSFASSLAGPVGAVAGFIDHPTLENGLVTAASIICPPIGLLAGFVSMIADAFKVPTITGEQQEINKAAIEATMSEGAIKRSGGRSINEIRSAISKLATTDKDADHRFCEINHLRCLIEEEANKTTNSFQKNILKEMCIKIEIANPYSKSFSFVMDGGNTDPVIQNRAAAIDKAFEEAATVLEAINR